MSETRYTPEHLRDEAMAFDELSEDTAEMLRQAATDAEALAAKDERIAALIHERDVLQRISARRAGALERVGLHADCTMEEATALALTGDATEGQG